MDVLGSIFQTLTKLGGGSELVPLIVFCVVLVLLGLALGLGIMRFIRRSPVEPEAEQSG
jgi:cytochrome bd-type quinol oxidase subunit 1